MRSKYLAAGILVLIVGFLLGWGFAPAPAARPLAPANTPAGSNQLSEVQKAKTVSVMLDFGDGTVRTFTDIDVSGTKTVFDLLKSLSESGKGFVFSYQPPGQYGVMVEQIGNKKNGDEGKYWMFWMNNRLAEVAADRQSVAVGDVIEWKFINLKSEGGGQP
ncbi:DUF4430 domain-containing protein [Patescibacteria group bacterium]|nr:MAG: DUF4430 domain-containing protein [Patescibacteria group bacterium]